MQTSPATLAWTPRLAGSFGSSCAEIRQRRTGAIRYWSSTGPRGEGHKPPTLMLVLVLLPPAPDPWSSSCETHLYRSARPVCCSGRSRLARLDAHLGHKTIGRSPGRAGACIAPCSAGRFPAAPGGRRGRDAAAQGAAACGVCRLRGELPRGGGAPPCQRLLLRREFEEGARV
jgi:hypothetical protein